MINNFDTNDEGKLNLGEFSPKCRLRCSNGLCSIQDFKPLVCLFYPIILEKYENDKHYWSLHKKCKYYYDLELSGKREVVINEFLNLLDNISEELMMKIIDSYKNLSSISYSYYTSDDIEVIKEVNLNV